MENKWEERYKKLRVKTFSLLIAAKQAHKAMENSTASSTAQDRLKEAIDSFEGDLE